MKLYITLFVLILSCLFHSTKAFANNGPIDVTANENFTVTLFFPSEIEKVVAPANNFTFVYKTNENLGTLTGRKGTASNLTVITADGLIFSFSLNYSEKIENYTYILSKEQAAGVLSNKKHKETLVQKSKPISEDMPSREKKQVALKSYAEPDTSTVLATNNIGKERTLYEMDRTEYYRIFCENNFRQEARVKDVYTEIGGVQMHVKSILRDRNEVYITLNVSNTLETEYAMKEPRFFVRTKGNKTPMQMQSLYAFNYKKVVDSESQTSLVYVFKDFSLGNDQQVYVLIDSFGNKKQLVLSLAKTLF